MTRDELIEEAKLRAREARGRAETVLLNRAVRRRKNRGDELVTKAVQMVVPEVPRDPHELRRGGADRPPKRRDEDAFDEIVRQG